LRGDRAVNQLAEKNMRLLSRGKADFGLPKMTKIRLNCYRTIFRYANILGNNFSKNRLHNSTRYIYMW